MGGRGGSSGISQGTLANGFNGKWFGVRVTNDGGAIREYFFRQTENTTLMRTSLAESAKKSPVSAQKFVSNARERNSRVEIINPSEVERRTRERNRERQSRPDYEHGIGTEWGNRNNREAARVSRLASRRRRRR